MVCKFISNSLLHKLSQVLKRLVGNYLQGLDADLLQEEVKNVQTSIRLQDEQLQMLDSCSICLLYTKNGQRYRDVYNMASPASKQDWVMDYRAVKLSQGTGYLPFTSLISFGLIIFNTLFPLWFNCFWHLKRLRRHSQL